MHFRILLSLTILLTAAAAAIPGTPLNNDIEERGNNEPTTPCPSKCLYYGDEARNRIFSQQLQLTNLLNSASHHLDIIARRHAW